MVFALHTREDTFKLGLRKLQIKAPKMDWLIKEYRYIPEHHIDEFHGKQSFQERVEHQLERQELASLATMKALERLMHDVSVLKDELVPGASGNAALGVAARTNVSSVTTSPRSSRAAQQKQLQRLTAAIAQPGKTDD